MTAPNQATERDLEALRTATREAHEAIRDLRTETKRAAAVAGEVAAVADVEVEQRIAAAVAAGLEEYRATLDGAIKDATEAVFARFDTIRDTLLGETKRHRRRGEPSLPELIEDRRT
jgi:hypothetical protein